MRGHRKSTKEGEKGYKAQREQKQEKHVQNLVKAGFESCVLGSPADGGPGWAGARGGL